MSLLQTTLQMYIESMFMIFHAGLVEAILYNIIHPATAVYHFIASIMYERTQSVLQLSYVYRFDHTGNLEQRREDYSKLSSQNKVRCRLFPQKVCGCNNNTQKAAIAKLPLTTHPPWAEPHTFTSLEQIHAPITSLEWLNLPLLPFLPFRNLPS